ncbi:hypothetical protein TNCV_5060791 [Trichonephila clavipes]|nr:hypothetical protein TNCV_5060791 [Trichonephila clavipes]
MTSFGIHQVQCIGAGGRHPSWHRQQPGQVSGGILSKSLVQWFGDCLSSHQLSRDRTHSDQCLPWVSKALGVLGRGSTFGYVCVYNSHCSS